MRFNANGFSLVEALVATLIMAILGAAFTSLMSTMQVENRAMSDKVEAVDFERQFAQFMSDDSLCTCQIFNKGDMVEVAPLPSGTKQYELNINRITTNCAVTDPSQILAEVGKPVKSLPNSFVVKRVYVNGITPTGRLDAAGKPDQYLGAITVEFDSSKSVAGRGMRGLKASKIFVANGKKLISCAGTGGGVTGAPTGGIEYYQGPTVTNGAIGSSAPSAAYCPSGYKVTGGGHHSTGGGTSCTNSTVLESRMVQNVGGAWGWVVHATCLKYHVVAACQKEF